MEHFIDIQEQSLKKSGEELCGDTVKITKKSGKTIAVLSDGLGSGVKANILSTLTTEILNTMLYHDVPLEEVMRTVVGTLPMCRTRKLAYATFAVLEINEKNRHFKVINSDNPQLFYFKRGKLVRPERKKIRVMEKEIVTYEGTLDKGDFLGMASDGILYAGLGKSLNFGWGWEEISSFIESLLKRKDLSPKEIVSAVIAETLKLYGDQVGDDATFVGIQVREKQKLVVFTGPPLKREEEEIHIKYFLNFDGQKVICGGTTANIVSRHLKEEILTDLGTLTSDVPPMAKMKGVDLVTEGIVTLAKAIEYLKEGKIISSRFIKKDGATCLLQRMMEADHVVFLVGQTINPFYQNPLLPKNISIRVSLVKELAAILRAHRKEVIIKCI